MGHPVSDNTLTSYIESSRYTKTPRGTETSKYPEEKKENSILQVAASERGRAQTVVRARRGMDCDMAVWKIVEGSGKSRQRE